jgi:DNA repair protein RadC
MKKKTVNIINFENVETIYRWIPLTWNVKFREEFATLPRVDLQTITRPIDLKDICRTIYATLDEDQEHLVILIANVAHAIAGYKVIASGSQDHVEVEPRIIFRHALLLGAAKIIVVHNHPTGGSDPSERDLEITRKLVEAGELLNLEVLDHIIWTGSDVSSIRKHSPDCFNL